MPSLTRRGWPVLVATAALTAAAACSSAPHPAQSCQSAEECPAGARCISNACVANAPPVPDVALPPGALATYVLLTFDASSSADPDAGDSVAARTWAFRSLTAPCSPPVSASTGPQATVRFPCPGRYEVELSASDQMAASATVVKTFDVAPYTGDPPVVVGSDVATGHGCSNPLPYCVVHPVRLDAGTPGLAPGAASFEWTVEPPAGLPLDAHRRVTFTPSANVPSPTVLIETDGQAISGDWIFRVQATDAAGVIGTGAMRVSVGNRAPVVVGGVLDVAGHAFSDGQFTSDGHIVLSVHDPDGDELVGRTVEWHHTGDGEGSMFTGVDLGGTLTYAIAVPCAAPEDAAHLIGGAGLERSIRFTISDANGAQVVQSWPIVVGNRPPVLDSSVGPFVMDHSFNTARNAYELIPPIARWTDPDGDPMEQVPSVPTGDAQCPTVFLVYGQAYAMCSLPFTGMGTIANFVGSHMVTHKMRDPWSDSVATSSVSFTIGNRAPVLAPTQIGVNTECTFDGTCCEFGDTCSRYLAVASAGSATAFLAWLDPDGDPIAMDTSASGTVTPLPPFACTRNRGCGFSLAIAPAEVCGQLWTNVPTTATDGLATATTSFSVIHGCSN